MTTEDLQQYLGEAAEYLKPSSLGHRVRFIKSLFKWSHEEGFILKSPAAKLKEPKMGKRIPKFLSEHEIEHLREGCHTSMEKALFEFFYSTGCRIGEVAKLNRDDINFMLSVFQIVPELTKQLIHINYVIVMLHTWLIMALV